MADIPVRVFSCTPEFSLQIWQPCLKLKAQVIGRITWVLFVITAFTLQACCLALSITSLLSPSPFKRVAHCTSPMPTVSYLSWFYPAYLNVRTRMMGLQSCPHLKISCLGGFFFRIALVFHKCRLGRESYCS